MWWDTIYTVVQINGQVLVVDVVVEKNVMIQAADGILLATDIYRPANQGVSGEKPFPVLLHRTPYKLAKIAEPGL